MKTKCNFQKIGRRNHLSIFILLMLSFSTLTQAQNWNQVLKAVATDRNSYDNYGGEVSISGSYAIVGASKEDEDENGGNYLKDAGSVYMLELGASGVWSETQKIVASDRQQEDYFGRSVAISGDYAVVGAYGQDYDASGSDKKTIAGAVYVFKRNTEGVWEEVQKLVASDREAQDFFGISVSISGDYLMVGAYRESHDASGTDSKTFAGSVYVFEQNISGVWEEVQKIVASDRTSSDYFGFSVSLSGDKAVIGAFQEDHDESGENMMSLSGSAYIFERNVSGEWLEVQKIVASDRAVDDYFGYSVSISGDYILVGADREDQDPSGANTKNYAGAAYVFKRSEAGVWSQIQKITASDRNTTDHFGRSVSISGNYAIVGAFREDDDEVGTNAKSEAGSAYIFERNESDVWSEKKKVVASDRASEDYFGNSVGISGENAIVGAHQEDEDNEGINTNLSAGSAYVFHPILAQTITFNSLADITYGDADVNLEATSTSGLAVSYSSSDASVAEIVDNKVKAVGAGTVTIHANQIGNVDYGSAPQISQSFSVAPKEITVTGAVAENKVYDGTTDATVSGATLQGVVGNDDVELTNADLGIFASLNVGIDINVSSEMDLIGADASNYIFTKPELSANITQVALEITADEKTKVLGEDDPALTYQITQGNLVLGEELVGEISREAGEELGTYNISQGTLDAGSNYSITFIPATFTITTATSLQNQLKGELVVFPNPASNNLTVSANKVIHKIQLFNVLGEEKLLLLSNKNSQELNVSDLKPGVYVLVVYSNEKRLIQNLIIK